MNQAKMIDTTPPGNGDPGLGGEVHTMELGPAAMRDIPMIPPTIE